MFLYTWEKQPPDDPSIPKISIYENSKKEKVVRKQTPGLSSFAARLEEIPDYLGPLLDLAAANIPKNAQMETPLFVLATAGMRFLSEDEQAAIWNRVRMFAASKYNFKFSHHMAHTISGTEEGIYGWITVNYLLGSFDGNRIKQTAGMLDLGGGSMQIAYQLPQDFSQPDDNIFRLNLKPDVDASSFEFSLYSTTFLGYGVNAAKSLYRGMLAANIITSSSNNRKPVEINDPCLPVHEIDTIKSVDVAHYGEFVDRNFTTQFADRNITLIGTGDTSLCAQTLRPLLGKAAFCQLPPCSMNGVFQPELPSHIKFYGLSEFWFTLDDITQQPYYKKRDFIDHSKQFCQSNWRSIKQRIQKEFKANAKELNHELQEKSARCFNAAWIVLVLHEGFGFPDEFDNFHPVNSLNDIEVQWSLGALIFKLSDSFNVPRSVLSSGGGRGWRVALLVLCVLLFASWLLFKYRKMETVFGPLSRCLRRNCPPAVVAYLLSKKRRFSRPSQFPSFSRLNGLDSDSLPLFEDPSSMNRGRSKISAGLTARSSSLPNFLQTVKH